MPLLTGGTTLAVIGVGGLGHLAIQELKATTPARIIAYDLSDAALELARELGADESRKSEAANFEKMSAEVVLDFVGAAATIGFSTHMIRPLGHIVVVGRGPGMFEFNHHSMPCGAAISTTFGGSKAELMELIGLAEAGLIAPHTTHFALGEVEVALDRLAKGEITGRAVIVP